MIKANSTERKTLQFLIDNICADFTIASLLSVTRACLAKGPASKKDIVQAIMKRDRTLDIKCAEGLVEGAVMALEDAGEVLVKGSRVYAKTSPAKSKRG